MGTTNPEKSLNVLKILSEALTVPRSMDEGLNHITRMTCQLMETGQAVFLLRDEERHELVVRSLVGISNVTIGSALVLPPRLWNILWKLRNQHTINWVDAGIDDIGFPVMACPVSVRGVRVGLLITGAASEPSPRPFDSVRQKLFALIAPFASLVIENAKGYDLLNQHVAVMVPELQKLKSAGAQDNSPAEEITVTSINDPTKVVKILAESFYKELRRTGFQAEHVATAAAQLLNCIVKDD